MILVIDIGNTNAVLGVYSGSKLVTSWRLTTDRNKTGDELGILVMDLFRYSKVTNRDIKGIIISSVVPTLMDALELMCKKYFGIEPMVVGPGIKTGMNIRVDNPKEVGADRIVNAIAAYEAYGGPLVILILVQQPHFALFPSRVNIWEDAFQQVLKSQLRLYSNMPRSCPESN